jgi:hypothetical protein
MTVTYWGTPEALLAAGCLTREMKPTTARCAMQKTARHARLDQHGHPYSLRRAPTKSLAERMKLERVLPLATAVQLPGVRDLLFADENTETNKYLAWKAAQALPRPSYLRLVWSNPAVT